MGRIRESISKLLTILLILILSLTPLSTVQAGYNGGQGGNGSHGVGTIGASESNTALFMYFVYSGSGKPATPGVIVSKYDLPDFGAGNTNYKTKKVISLADTNAMKFTDEEAPYPILSKDGAWISNGNAIREYLMTQANDGRYRYQYILKSVFTDKWDNVYDRIMEEPGEFCIVVQPVAILHCQTTYNRIATTDGWIQWVGSGYSHSFVSGAMYNCMVLERDRFGITAPTQTSGLHSMTDGQLETVGYGIHIIDLEDNPYQTTYDESQGDIPSPAPIESVGQITIVKNYREKDRTTNTYEEKGCYIRNSLSGKIEIEDELSYKVIGWAVSTTTTPSPTISSLTWESSIPNTITSTGTTPTTVDITTPSTCLYIISM